MLECSDGIGHVIGRGIEPCLAQEQARVVGRDGQARLELASGEIGVTGQAGELGELVVVERRVIDALQAARPISCVGRQPERIGIVADEVGVASAAGIDRRSGHQGRQPLVFGAGLHEIAHLEPRVAIDGHGPDVARRDGQDAVGELHGAVEVVQREADAGLGAQGVEAQRVDGQRPIEERVGASEAIDVGCAPGYLGLEARELDHRDVIGRIALDPRCPERDAVGDGHQRRVHRCPRRPGSEPRRAPRRRHRSPSPVRRRRHPSPTAGRPRCPWRRTPRSDDDVDPPGLVRPMAPMRLLPTAMAPAEMSRIAARRSIGLTSSAVG